MSETPPPRSVKIGSDERTGWSSERPRAGAPRPPDISTRCRILQPTDRMRYSPGSLLVVVGPAATDPLAFAERIAEPKGAVLALPRIRTLLAGRVADDEIEDRAADLLAATVRKRLESDQAVVLPLEGFDSEEREHYVRIAHGLRRPRHLILLDATPAEVTDDERPLLDELRRGLLAGELGQEGFQTAMRLGGAALTGLKKVVFRPAPRDE